MSFIEKLGLGAPENPGDIWNEIYANTVGQPKDTEYGTEVTIQRCSAPMEEAIRGRYGNNTAGDISFRSNHNITGEVEKATIVLLPGTTGLDFSERLHEYRTLHPTKRAMTPLRRFLLNVSANATAAASLVGESADNFAGAFANGNRAAPLERLLAGTQGFHLRHSANDALVVDVVWKDNPRMRGALELFAAKFDPHEVQADVHAHATADSRKTPVLSYSLFGAAAEAYAPAYQAYQRDMNRHKPPKQPSR